MDFTQVDCHTSAALGLEGKRRNFFEFTLGLVYDLVFSVLLLVKLCFNIACLKDTTMVIDLNIKL